MAQIQHSAYDRLEFNREGFSKKTLDHLLGIDLKVPIPPSLGFVEIVAQIHSQRGLGVAAHPHVMNSEWGKNTLFLWENQDVFAPILHAWEVANRNNIFTPVGLKRFAFLAGSDFHKPKHIYSWTPIPIPRGLAGYAPDTRRMRTVDNIVIYGIWSLDIFCWTQSPG